MKFLLFIPIFLLIVIFMKFKENNIEIKWRTFFKKGFLVDSGPWGVYCYTGKQGDGKTYSVVEFLNEHKDYKIYSNVNTLQGVPYIYIRTFEELLNIQNDTNENIIIFYDEIFTALTKNTKMSSDVLSFLSQMRKRHIIFLTTAQEWLEINITLRRYVRFQVECHNRSFLGKSYLIKKFYDGTQIHWDNLENDYIAPLISTTISKMNISIANSYDTYEVINSSNVNIKKNVNLMKNKEANGSAYFLSSSEQSEPINKLDPDIWENSKEESLIDEYR